MIRSRGDQDDQVAAINRLARKEAGALVDPPRHEPDEDKTPLEGRTKLPKICLPGEGRRVTDFAREAGRICCLNGVYRRESQPVIVDRESGGIEPLTAAKFCTELEEVSLTYVQRVIKSGGDEIIVEKAKTMTEATAKVTLASNAFIYGLRKLRRVNMVRQPILRRDGRIELLETGYDEESGILSMPSRVQVMTRSQVESLDADGREAARVAAAGVLRAVLEEFPFVAPLDRAVQVAAMVSSYGSLLMPLNGSRLNFMTKANKHRSGKTLLIRLSVVPVMGRAIIQSFPRDENQLSQRLAAAVLGAKSYLILDDIKGYLSSEILNGFLTADYWGDRLMHTQRQFEAERQAVVYLSGHEVVLSPDLAGRFLECRLHVEEADSLKHRVRRPIDEAYIARDDVRSEICSALNMLIMLWDLAGRPKGKTLRPGFENWCQIYGGIVEFAGFGDPCAQRPDDEGMDPEYEDMAILVRDLVEGFEAEEKMKEFTFAQLIERCVDLKAFTWAIEGQWKNEKDTGERWFQMSKKAESKMGWIFGQKYGGTIFSLAGGRRMRFGRNGKNRQRRYTLAVVE